MDKYKLSRRESVSSCVVSEINKRTVVVADTFSTLNCCIKG